MYKIVLRQLIFKTFLCFTGYLPIVQFFPMWPAEHEQM